MQTDLVYPGENPKRTSIVTLQVAANNTSHIFKQTLELQTTVNEWMNEFIIDKILDGGASSITSDQSQTLKQWHYLNIGNGRLKISVISISMCEYVLFFNLVTLNCQLNHQWKEIAIDQNFSHHLPIRKFLDF